MSKIYPAPLKRVLDLDSKEVIVKVPKVNIWNLAVKYQKAHQAALGGHKLTISEICTLIISQGIEKTKEQIQEFKKQIK